MIVPLAPEAAAAANFSVGRSAVELYSPRRRSSEMSFRRPRTRQNTGPPTYHGIPPQMLVRQPPTFWRRSLRSGACRWSSDFLEIRTRTLWTHYAGAKTRSDSSWFVMKKALLLWPAVTQSLLVSWASALARRGREGGTCSMGFMTQSSMGPRFWRSPARHLGPYWVPNLLKGWTRLACTRT